MFSTPASSDAAAAVAGAGPASAADMHGELLVPAGADLIGRLPSSLAADDVTAVSTPAIESMPAAREN